MKAAILAIFLLSGCAHCPDCLTIKKDQLVKALGQAWQHGYGKGYDAAEDADDLRNLRPL